MSSTGQADATTELLDSSIAMRSYLNILNDGSSTNMNISTVRSLVLKAIVHPEIFCGFDELKNCCSQLLLPQGQTTENHASKSIFNTLDLFSFGTTNDYQKQGETKGENDDYYLSLNEPALAKLRQLTVITSVQKACYDGKMCISYDDVAEALGLTNDTMQDGNSSVLTAPTAIRNVEDVLIQCSYSNVLKGKLSQKSRTFVWKGESLPVVSSRDVPSTLVPNLLSELRGLKQRLEESGTDLNKEQANVTQGLDNVADFWKTFQKHKKTTQEESVSQGGGGGSGTYVERALLGGNAGGWHESSGGSASINNPRRSSKRSRGGMSGFFQSDAGKRI